MKTILLFFTAFVCLLFSVKSQAQQSLWNKVDETSYNSYTTLRGVSPEKFLLSKIDLAKLKFLLRSAPLESNDGKFTKGIPFSILLPDETMLSTSITESPIWEAKYADQFSNIKTYVLSDPVTKTLQGRIAVTAKGISGIIFSDKGTVYINPVNINNEYDHILYYTKDEKVSMMPCEAKADENSALNLNRASGTTAIDSRRRTYRLAIATTAEYTAWAGSQDNARMYIAIAMNNVMAIYDRDLNIRFTIIAPNSIIFTNPNTDPYPGGDVYLDNSATNANQIALDNIIGTANYDLGMVFNRGWNRGFVPPPFGYVCNAASKGKGAAGTMNGIGLNPTAGPQGLGFDFTVAHEMGHLFGAPHSYASNTGFCSGFSTPSSAFEPGSGSTLMGYAGYPDCNTYTSYGEHYFHAGTIAIIQSYIGGAGNCVQPVITGNTPPVVSVTATSYNIPVSTPFSLHASGTDADGDILIYNWEQMDAGVLTSSPPSANSTGGPNFRSYAPATTGNTRIFPRIYDIAAGISPPYEVLPAVTRTMNFRVTARDQSSLGGCIGQANIAVNFKSIAGTFTVTSQQSVVTWTANGSNTQIITWNVAGTNAAPVNCTAVNILFSADGGITYPYMLVSSTNNDGSEIITVPNISTKSGRIKVEAADNIFFNINPANITVISTCTAEGTTFTPSDSVSAPAGSAELNLSLSPQYGTA
ncbi:MAG: reprolysin-like metallopeptidase, partial [Ginsengibacter sp.]